MPEQTKHRRASGSWVSADVTVRRAYGKADMGPACYVCRRPIVRQLAAAGITVHPACAEVDS